MHEFSIVSHLLKSCEEIARENGAKKILVVYVEIGERSGVDSELLQSAFSEFKKGSLCEDAALHITQSKVELACKTCGATSVPKTINYTECEKCGSNDVIIVRGDTMLLLRLEME